MKSTIWVLAIVMALGMGPTVVSVHAQSGFEKEPVLQAKDLVAQGLLKGPHYTVDPR